MGVFFAVFSMVLSLIWKAVKFTGLWISVLLLLFIERVILHGVFQIVLTPASHPELFPLYEKAMIVVMTVPVVLITGYHIYKLFKGPTDKPVEEAREDGFCTPEALVGLTQEEKIQKTRELAEELIRRRRGG